MLVAKPSCALVGLVMPSLARLALAMLVAKSCLGAAVVVVVVGVVVTVTPTVWADAPMAANTAVSTAVRHPVLEKSGWLCVM